VTGTSRPTSIRIFLANGSPDGIRVVEKSNWTGRAIVASRNHASRKDFWTWFVAFTSTDENLNKAHVRYLESRLLARAKTANQWALDNTAAPNEPPLSEAARADADWFLAEMLVIYPILGIDAFEIAAHEPAPRDDAGDFVLEQRGAAARGRETRDGFVVLEGSQARLHEVGSAKPWLRDLRQQLLDRGVLDQADGHVVFTRFPSPSRAAAVLVGGNANGRKAWRTPDGRMLRDVQAERTG